AALEEMSARRLRVGVRDHAFVMALCEAKTWGRLESLHLSGMNFTRDLFDGFLAHPSLSGLRELELVGCRLDLYKLTRLANCPALANLRRLTLDDDTPILGPLTKSRHLNRLTSVRGWGEEDDVIAFVRSPNAGHVRWLHAETFTDKIAEA